MKIKKIWSNIIFFFPFQLLFVHFKRNQILLLFWVILIAIINNDIAVSYGIPLLFHVPEYLGKVNFWSYFILGNLIGSFIIAYNISSYIVNAYLFPFIITTPHPFAKYTLNNFIIPLIFIILYIYKSAEIQANSEFLTSRQISYNIAGFLSGITLFIGLSFSYFFSTNKDIFKFIGLSKKKFDEKKISKPLKKLLYKDMKWKIDKSPQENKGMWRVKTYLNTPFTIKLARNFGHYKQDMVQKVLQQNHYNGAFYSISIIIILIVLGFFKENQYFTIPAAASITIIFTIFMLMFSAMHSVLKEWSFSFFILAILLVNYFSSLFFFDHSNSAYGLKYSKVIEQKEIDKKIQKNNYNDDIKSTTEILNKWKEKNRIDKKKWKKPKIVFICSSGGGLKASIWTYYSISVIDSLLKGKLLKHTFLITGASGGMLGAAYLRELYLQYVNNEIDSYYNDSLLNNLSKDLLNPIAFSAVVSDWFWQIQKFKYKGEYYYKDRAYSFEKKLNKNTHNILDKRIIDYKKAESEAIIPMLILSPTIINNGGKLIISPQNVSYLCSKNKFYSNRNYYNIEFRKKYKNYNADNLRFTTAIRMNASFPYISPIINLPGDLKVMDAGLNDNFGLSTAIEFVYHFRNWIEKNTDGVIFLQISEKAALYKPKDNLFNKIFNPVESIVKNYFNFQQINNEKHLKYNSYLKSKIHYINLNLMGDDKEIALSWHLTKKEKKAIIESINYKENKKSIEKLIKLLSN